MRTIHIQNGWVLSGIVWSVVILLLTGLNLLHDQFVSKAHQMNNHPLWALQEWGLWYLFTPITFKLLTQYYTKNKSIEYQNYTLICGVILCSTMTYQAIFDYYFYDDPIPGTLVYFAPSHPTVLFLIALIWNQFLRPPKVPETQYVLVDTQQGQKQLQLNDIVHINAASNYVEIFTHQETYLKRTPLKDIEKHLPCDQFARTHRSHLINMSHIDTLQTSPTGSTVIHMNNGQSVNLSRAYKQQIKNRYSQP